MQETVLHHLNPKGKYLKIYIFNGNNSNVCLIMVLSLLRRGAANTDSVQMGWKTCKIGGRFIQRSLMVSFKSVNNEELHA
jgi:hypothetical protein